MTHQVLQELLLAIDVGNTNTMVTCFDGERSMCSFRLRTDRHATQDEWGLRMCQLLERHGIEPNMLHHGIVGSVVPQIERALTGACREYLSLEPIFVNPDNAGLLVDVESPEQVGADRYINAVAAFSEFKQALIVIDFGTATTYDVVDARGAYIGGAIAPGIDVSMEALCNRTSKLPRVEIKAPKDAVGRNTRTAMQSGLYFMYLGGIDGMIHAIWDALGEKTPVIATGGLAPFFSEASKTITHVRDHLTMHGLRHIFHTLNGQ